MTFVAPLAIAVSTNTPEEVIFAAAMRASIAKGESLQTALKDEGDDLRRDWKLWDEFHLRNATNAYIELERE